MMRTARVPVILFIYLLLFGIWYYNI
jgi:hypothetical protein